MENTNKRPIKEFKTTKSTRVCNRATRIVDYSKDMSDVQQPPNNDPSDPTNASSPTIRLEPVTESIVVPQPWFRRIFGQITRTETLWKLSVVALMIVGVFIGQSMQAPQTTITHAAVGKARISIYPLESKLPPDKSFQLWMTTDQTVSSANVTFSFDPKAIQLSREITPNAIDSTDLTFTSWKKANQSGLVEFKVNPKTKTEPLAIGTFQLGTFYFTTTKGTTSTTATIMISKDKTLIVNQDSIPFTLNTTNATVTLK